MKLKRLLPLMVLPFILASCGEKPSNGSVKKSDNPTSEKASEKAPSTLPDSGKGSTDTPDTPTETTFKMEAEYTNVTGKKGAGYSGGNSGKDMIQKDEKGDAKASNGYWLGYLYVSNMSVDFVFNSTKAVEDVSLTLRLTCEIKDIVLTSKNYKVQVNGTDIEDYGTINLSGASNSDSSGYIRPFSNHKLKKKLSLKQGENTIKLITANSDGMGGTMYATAPMVDCVTLSDFKDAHLSYDPIYDNLSLFEE